MYKTLYGHQETCLGLELSNDSRYVASCDTLKKINVANWPNVFNMQSVLLEHTLPLSYFCFIGSQAMASLSEGHATTKLHDLILSKPADGSVFYREKVNGVKAMV